MLLPEKINNIVECKTLGDLYHLSHTLQERYERPDDNQEICNMPTIMTNRVYVEAYSLQISRGRVQYLCTLGSRLHRLAHRD